VTKAKGVAARAATPFFVTWQNPDTKSETQGWI
jgi:hypothetical protein